MCSMHSHVTCPCAPLCNLVPQDYTTENEKREEMLYIVPSITPYNSFIYLLLSCIWYFYVTLWNTKLCILYIIDLNRRGMVQYVLLTKSLVCLMWSCAVKKRTLKFDFWCWEWPTDRVLELNALFLVIYLFLVFKLERVQTNQTRLSETWFAAGSYSAATTQAQHAYNRSILLESQGTRQWENSAVVGPSIEPVMEFVRLVVQYYHRFKFYLDS